MQWVQTLFLLCEVAYTCQLADIDPVAVAEMTLRLASVLEDNAESPSLIIPAKRTKITHYFAGLLDIYLY